MQQLRRQTVYIINEVALRFFIVLCFLYSEGMKPFERVIQPEEWWLYKNPKIENQVFSTMKLYLIVTIAPLLTILLCRVFCRHQPSDIIPAFLCSSLILVLNGLITNCIKLGVGRPRPDFFYRCFPDGKPPGGQPSTLHLQCTGDIDQIVEGRKSFPSGHSSFSFASLGFCSLYLFGKLQCFNGVGRGASWRLCVCLLPLLSAIMIAVSRTCDYRHHWQDILVGSGLGFSLAYLVYRQYYPCLSSNHCSLSYFHQRDDDELPTTAPSTFVGVKHM